MKATGIVRRIDDLGRICIPKEIRQSMNIQEGDALEYCVGEGSNGRPMLCLQKYRASMTRLNGARLMDNAIKLVDSDDGANLTDGDRALIIASLEYIKTKIGSMNYEYATGEDEWE